MSLVVVLGHPCSGLVDRFDLSWIKLIWFDLFNLLIGLIRLGVCVVD